MNFTELFIKRPALTIVIMLVITIIGLMSYKNLQVRWIPNVTPPIVSIDTRYPGASPSLVESQVTTPIENALAGVDGIESINSNSKQGMSDVSLTFRIGHNINSAVEDVRSALQGATESFPKDVKPPIVGKWDLNGEPIIYIAFSDEHRTDKEVSNYVKQFVTPRIQSIEGVATVQTYGERTFAMRIWLDPMKMAAANVTVDDVSHVLDQQNVQVPSGQIHGANRLYTVVTNETLRSANEFNELTIRANQGQIIRLKDIGQAVVDVENADSAFRADGQSAVALAIVPQSTANPLSVADKVETQFQQFKKTLPAGMQAKIIYNEANFIHASIDSVYESLAEAVAFVLIVIFLFLAAWRAAIIPIVTIPICLISSFAVLYLLGFTINTVTLMAFVLAIGLVVDDAIVMLENISRHIESGLSPFAAAIKGSREIVFPIIAMTVTLVAVYAPIAFTSGILGSVFREFAVTLAATVLISGFVALTLSPMMCSRMLVKQEQNTRYAEWLKEKFTFLQQTYANLLFTLLAKKKWILLSLILVSGIGVLTYLYLPSELAPSEDMSQVEISIAGPRNASFQYTDAYAHQLEKIYKTIPEVESYGSSVGFGSPSRGFQFLTLKPQNKRHRTAQEVADDLSAQVKSLPGVRVSVFTPPPPLTWFSEGNGSSIYLEVMSATDYRSLHTIMQQLIIDAQKYPGFSKVDSKLKWDGEQFELNINREKAADMQVPMPNITNTISTFLAGRNVGYFEYDGNQYNIVMQMNQASLSSPKIISQLYVRNESNKMVPISGLVTMHETTTPEVLPHFDRFRDDVLYVTLAPGYTIGEAVKALQKIAKESLPDNAKFMFQGQAKDYLDSAGNTVITFLLALVFIYLILVAQFESFIDPLIILLTVPFAMIGALVTLKLTGCSLNMYSNIGLVTLIGLIAKHGILITEFANQKRALGMTVQAAVVEAATLRLRPILMTTAAMVLGALPLALASGSGAESRQQVGWVIVGGMLLGTFFSLIVVPVAYTFLARWKKVTMSKEYWLSVSKELEESL
jgi:multidrug efflux pump